VLSEEGFDGILLENYGDLPFYPDRVPVETAAAMAAVLTVLRTSIRAPISWGVNVLRNDARAAVAVAAAAGASFIRVNVHVGAVLTDQGILQGRAHETLRARSALAPQLAIFADVQVKHGLSLVPIPLEAEADDLRDRGLADVVLVTGNRTGSPPTVDEVLAVVRAAAPLPVLVASGVAPQNAPLFLAHARGFIVGTSLKRGGRIENPVDALRARRLIQAVRSPRGRSRRAVRGRA